MLEGEPWPNTRSGIPSSATSRYQHSLDSAILAIVFLPTPSNHSANTRLGKPDATLANHQYHGTWRRGSVPAAVSSATRSGEPVANHDISTHFPPMSTQTNCIFRI